MFYSLACHLSARNETSLLSWQERSQPNLAATYRCFNGRLKLRERRAGDVCQIHILLRKIYVPTMKYSNWIQAERSGFDSRQRADQI